MDVPFEWEAPDLIEGGYWREAHLHKVRTISQGWHGQDSVLLEGRRLLSSRRLNYTSQGAQCFDIIDGTGLQSIGNHCFLEPQ
jgi:hypothetical protein